MHYSENELWEQTKEGSLQAYEQLFHRLYAPLCNYANKYLADTDEAENVVQELFCNIWEKRGEITLSFGIKAYMYKSVFNKALNEMKKVKRLEPLQTSDHENELDVHKAYQIGLEVSHFNELQQVYQQALTQMPEGRRTIFELSRQEGLSYREIADALQISIKTVEGQMGKALGFLRIRLADFLLLLFIVKLMSLQTQNFTI